MKVYVVISADRWNVYVEEVFQLEKTAERFVNEKNESITEGRFSFRDWSYYEKELK